MEGRPLTNEFYQELCRAVHDSLEMRSVVEGSLGCALRFLPLEGVTLMIRRGKGLQKFWQKEVSAPLEEQMLRIEPSLTERVLTGVEELTYRRGDIEMGFESTIDGIPGLDIHDVRLLPIRRRGRAIGALGLVNAGAWDDELRGRALALAEETGRALRKIFRHERTEKLAITDELTGIYNYRYLVHILQHELKRSLRFGRALSVAMVDVDNLKSFNDTYGHLRGSAALRDIAQLLKRGTRAFDIVAKYGGDEFGLVLPETAEKQAFLTAERIRKAVEAHRFSTGDGRSEGESLTIKIGIASFPRDGQLPMQLLDAADKALYEAARLGKNLVVSYSQIADQEAVWGSEGASR
jgi:diguanylate cyclase (GGDEF)-like protein